MYKIYSSNPPVINALFDAEPAMDLEPCTNNKGKIETPISGICNMPVYKSEWDLDVLFNYIYYSEYGSPYFIKNQYVNKMNKQYLSIQFFNTRSTATISLKKFKICNSKIDMEDPYELTMFGGMCCIGNIDYEILGRVEPYMHMIDGPYFYNVWCEMMRRCFDPTHPYHQLFAEQNIRPLYCEWRCFRYFYRYFDAVNHNIIETPDPNDQLYYINKNRILDLDMMIHTRQFPSPVNYSKLEKKGYYEYLRQSKFKPKLYSVVKS